MHCADTDRELLSLYADLTARLGVELAGFQPPLTSARTADALRLSLDSSVETGACQLRRQAAALSWRLRRWRT